MDIKNSYEFQAPREKVFKALLDPSIMQSSIPGCTEVWYPNPNRMKVRVASPVPLPGLQGPYDIAVDILEQQEPENLVLQAGRQGNIGGTIDARIHLHLSDTATGSLLAYEAHIELTGLIAFVDNPIFQEVFKHSLTTFLKNLNTAITK
ncbi:hypothetical protein EPA93_42275 [Ktedonosporobacter rubrisoli]|uniref:Carbon monoxide dehydrogenase n=1 Tax=Ktedonosporobacter rubrisoli TaxID=2509675 RepID=A0A4P6K414_KTERU|nr:SRPBCC domain-containing protein [Ktedonosporobacter rubrisoli]QBD82256.1 hypothetical protein EPA93_42275 [Ktedonosporobacter rubrisoli]